MSIPQVRAAGKTDVGKARTNNEDSMLCDDALGLFIVADGMGGHNAGEVASAMAVKIIDENMRMLAKTGSSPEAVAPGLSLTANQLGFCAKLANQVIFESACKYPQHEGMGTTMSALVLTADSYHIAHIGDSRIYLARHDRLEQITQDHSLVMEQVKKGLITARQAETSRMANVLTRALGIEAHSKIDVSEAPLQDHDMFLLCSDGLNKMLRDDEIWTIVKTAKQPAAICESLVEAANAVGGKDNVTVVVIDAVKKGFLRNLKDKLVK
ncbi:MAG: Stp1/IreP family PP2C-type Ser/Thr phosphatase [Elusimicrobiota bacterium]